MSDHVIMRAGRCGHHFDENCDGCVKSLEWTNAEMDRLRAPDPRLALLDRMAGVLRWFHDRRFALRAKFDLHGPSDTAAALDEALTNVFNLLAEYDALKGSTDAA